MSFYQKIFSHFPPPRFLTMPALGVHISESAIRAIQLERKNNNYEILYWNEIPLPTGSISLGEIKDEGVIVKALKDIKTKSGGKFAYISIPEEKSFLFEIEIPTDINVDIKQAIEFRLEENVPFPANELVFDYILSHTKYPNQPSYYSSNPKSSNLKDNSHKASLL